MTDSCISHTTRSYYNSNDADTFYSLIWGGEDIHIGIYTSEEDSILAASHRTVTRMAELLGDLDETSRVVNIGSGYGGAARFLARSSGCRVTTLNISEVENAKAQMLNAEQGLQTKIEVINGVFENIPYPDATFDLVWSQDAIIHSGNRNKVLTEVARVLKPGGDFVFTDIMQVDDCPSGVLQPILDRFPLESLGSPCIYRKAASCLGMREEIFVELTSHLVTHYSRVLKETERRHDELTTKISYEYIKWMKTGLRYWLDSGKKGYLVWGIFHFRKDRTRLPLGPCQED